MPPFVFTATTVRVWCACIVQIKMKPFWNAQHIFQKVIKRIELCKSANFEKSIRVNGYIDNNEKMKPFWNVQHPVQKSKWPNLANPQILKKVFLKMDVFIIMKKNTKWNHLEMPKIHFKKWWKGSNRANPQILKKVFVWMDILIIMKKIQWNHFDMSNIQLKK